MRERLSANPNDVIVKHLIRPRLSGDLGQDFLQMSRLNRAHAVMLGETGILSRDVVGKILEGLGRLDKAGVSAIDLNPDLEDLYFNLEHALIEDIGPEAGGRLHTARSRNDLYAAILRLKTRAASLRVSHLLLDLAETIINRAEAEVATVMTGYTHGQPGQPITAGHYLSGISQALIRDAVRLVDGYDRINMNPLGACAVATTTYPIDRERTATLLGFDGLVENSIDAVASRDYVPELLFDMALPATTVSRLCADLHVWYMAEFNYIGIDDSIAGTSSIMPQKKNPSPIEHLKAKASHLYGALMTSLSAQRGAFFTHGRENGTESTAILGEAIRQFEAVMELGRAVVDGLVFNREQLLANVDGNYSTMTELADAYVTDHGMSFREAHKITGALVREAHALRLKGSSEITVKMVNDLASSQVANAPQLSEDYLKAVLDAGRSVQRRSVRGGPSEASVTRMLDSQTKEAKRLRGLLELRERRIATADAQLEESVAAFTERQTA
jgi:argininosuccinate lyase